MPEQISAIVPTYNRAAYVVEAVQALRAQTRDLAEIIVWDDGSSDGTDAALAPLVKALGTRLRYFRTENRGKSAALNAAMQEASGGYIWICDDDDLARPDAAQKLAHALDQGQAGLAAGRHIRFREDPQTKARETLDTGYWPDLSQGSVLRHLLEDVFFFQNATLVRRAAYDRVGPFREDLARSIDYEMFVRLGARFPIDMVPGILFDQRKHDGARGPAQARHAADKSEAVWLDHDREIFADFRAVLPLSLYEAMYDSDEPVLQQRAGVLQRACVYARRSDWNAALEDFTAAIALAGDRPLCHGERAIAIRAMAGKHGCADAFRAPVKNALMAFKSVNAAGKSLAGALARGAVWRGRVALKARDIREAARVAAFVARGRAPHTDTPVSGELSERQTLPPHAYEW